jgi:hypothetical protein
MHTRPTPFNLSTWKPGSCHQLRILSYPWGARGLWKPSTVECSEAVRNISKTHLSQMRGCNKVLSLIPSTEKKKSKREGERKGAREGRREGGREKENHLSPKHTAQNHSHRRAFRLQQAPNHL